jgi:hypothetical protein
MNAAVVVHNRLPPDPPAAVNWAAHCWGPSLVVPARGGLWVSRPSYHRRASSPTPSLPETKNQQQEHEMYVRPRCGSCL